MRLESRVANFIRDPRTRIEHRVHEIKIADASVFRSAISRSVKIYGKRSRAFEEDPTRVVDRVFHDCETITFLSRRTVAYASVNSAHTDSRGTVRVDFHQEPSARSVIRVITQKKKRERGRDRQPDFSVRKRRTKR